MAARGSQMRVIFPKPSEFGRGEEKALSKYLANKTQQSSAYVLVEGLPSAMKFGGGLAFLSVKEPVA